MDQQGDRLAVATKARLLPCHDVGCSCVANAAALLEGELASKHGSHYSLPTHSLLFPDVLDRKPARRML
jgi:hypothetical protein